MAREILGEGRYLRLIRQDGWEWVQRRDVSGVVVIAALTAAGEVLLVQQPRPALGTDTIELPAGLAGDLPGQRDEPLRQAALRELEEETGYTAARLEQVGSGPVSAGLTDEQITFFVARDLRRIGPGGGDETESIQVHEVPLDQVHAWLQERARQGIPTDPKVYAGLYFLSAARGPSAT